MVERALTVVEVMAVVGASRVTAVDWANARPRAWIWVECWKLLKIVVVQTAGVAAGGPLEWSFIFPVTLFSLRQGDV
jgi:hypothetical protein